MVQSQSSGYKSSINELIMLAAMKPRLNMDLDLTIIIFFPGQRKQGGKGL